MNHGPDSKSLRLLHTSDLHIGLHENGEAPERHKPLLCLNRVVDFANQERVDALLIAGDFFDNNRVKHALVEATIEALQRLDMPVVILPGNHDTLTPDSVYRKFNISGEVANASIISDPEGERLLFPDLDLAVWGLPHTDYDDFLPLASVPPRGEERWHVGMAHGHFIGSVADWGRAYPIQPEHVEDSAQDYIALGHWDWFQSVSQGQVHAYYSGSPMWSKTCALVELSDAGTVVTAVTPPGLP